MYDSSPKKWVLVAPTDATGGEEEPVHEDAGAVVIWVVGQQAVPLVLLLAGTVAVTP